MFTHNSVYKCLKVDIKELFQKVFKVNLPISGGMGNSIDNPVIIHSDGMLNDYVQTEYAVMDYMAIGREMEWKLIKQQFITHGNKKIDRLTVEVKGIGNNIMPLQHEFMYVDITEVFVH